MEDVEVIETGDPPLIVVVKELTMDVSTVDVDGSVVEFTVVVVNCVLVVELDTL
jgi:hypothetical protein